MRRRLLLAVVIIGSIVVPALSTPPAHASDDFVWFPYRQPWSKAVLLNSGYESCFMGVSDYVEERGKSGIVQMKAKFELRSPATAEWGAGGYPFNYAQRGWFYTVPFADDAVTHYHVFSAVSAFVEPPGGTYRIRLTARGIRLSLWRRDARIGVGQLPEVGCGSGDAISLG
jgi:hypothetical protein